ncbi:MAG: flagellar export chaperone FlgN [bacterium]
MTSGEIAQRLAGRVEEDLALFERFHALCEEELSWLERPDIEGLETLLEGKEALMKEIEERAEESAPLWTRFAEEGGEGGERGEDSLIGRMEENVGRIRTLIGRIQEVESAAADRLAQRKREAQDALGSLGRGGRALSAYRPVRIFSPRFLDKRE